MRLAASAVVILAQSMEARHVPADLKLSAISGLAAALGGCATYGSPGRNIAYFAVPCNTPGAFVAQPLSDPEAPPATPVPAAQTQGAQACLIAVPTRDLAYNARYRGGGGYYDLWIGVEKGPR